MPAWGSGAPAWHLDMAEYNQEALMDDFESHESAEYTGEVVSIEETIAGDVYGDKAREPERPMISLTVEVDTETGDDEFDTSYTLPKSALSWENPSFRLGQFIDRYGQPPEEGMDVDIEFSDDGFLRIAL